jgi:hypothetical protein
MFLFGSGAAQPFLTYGLASFAGLFSLAGLSKLIATNRDNWRLEDLRHLCAQTAAKLPAGQAWLSDTASNTDPLAALLKRNYPSRRSILTQSDGHWNLATTIDNKTHSLWLEGRI